MRQRLKNCIRVSAVILGVGCAYAAFCALTGLGLPCPFHLVTGLNCPGCGVSRMLLSMLRLDFAAAFRHNAALFCMTPVLALLAGVRIWRYVRLGERRGKPWMQATEIALAGLLVVWGVVRNLIGM